MKLLIGTANPGKQAEFKRILEKLARKSNIKLKIYFPQDFKIIDDIEETGKTFEKNSLIKAKHYYDLAKFPTIADDGGVEIKSLGGAPGVKSRRWLGRESSERELIKFTLNKMKNFKTVNRRKANLSAVLTYYDGKKWTQEKGVIEGYIANKVYPEFLPGFPYRGLFVVLPVNKYYDELTAQEHEEYNHRQKAMSSLWKRIIK